MKSDMLTIPPFEDHHMHFMSDGHPLLPNEIPPILKTYRSKGIYALRDMGHRTGVGLKAKKLLEGERVVTSAGYALFKKDGYGNFLGKGVSGRRQISDEISSIADGGADFIKVINSGIITFNGSLEVSAGGFTREELEVIADISGEKNLEVVCHASGSRAISDAIYAGVSSIEHGFFMTEDLLQMMKHASVAWTPTVFALKCALLLMPREAHKQGAILFEKHLQAIKHAAQCGVRLQIGTDSGARGIRHGEAYFEEIRLFRKAGLSLEEVLSAACMEQEQIQQGNFLDVKRDFLETGEMVSYSQGVRLP